MGNVHEVTQTEPFRSSAGAVLPLHEGGGLIEHAFPSYVSLVHASRAIGRSRIDGERSYLAIQTGGKWGYNHEFEQFLSDNAPVLEDAVFYVSDEYAMYVREWRIANGELTVEFVAPDNSHVGLVLVERAKHRDFGLHLLESMLDDLIWGGGDKEEPESVRFRAVMALVAHKPDRWQTWYQLGQLKADYAPHAAHEAYERALAIVPADKRSLVEIGMLRVLETLDPRRALAFGRANVERWIADAMRTREVDRYWNPIAAGLHRLAELERAHGAAELAAPLYVSWLRATDHDALAQRIYNLACIRALSDKAVARRFLTIAIALEPALAVTAASDPDLSSV